MTLRLFGAGGAFSRRYGTTCSMVTLRSGQRWLIDCGRQAPDQLDAAVTHFGLTEPEASIVGQLTRGRALWKLGGRTAVVHHVLGPSESAICDTDARMNARPADEVEAA